MTSTKPHLYLQRLLAALVLLTFGIIPYGALVRSTDSGLACPDWPLCHGKLIPDYKSYPKYLSASEKQKQGMDILAAQKIKQEENKDSIENLTKDKTIVDEEHFSAAQVYWEFTHRVWGALIGFVILIILILTLVSNRLKAYRGWGWLTFVLVVSQGILGQKTVTELLNPVFVSSHLLNALLLLGVEIYFLYLVAGRNARLGDPALDRSLMVRWRRTFTGGERSTQWGAWLLFGTVFVQIIIGGTVSSNYHGMACPRFPACIDGGIWFPALPGAHLHMTHRILAYLIVIGLGIYAHRAAKRLSPGMKWILRSAAVVVVLQTLLGIFNVLYSLPHGITAAHSFGAALLFSLTLVLTFHDRQLPEVSVESDD